MAKCRRRLLPAISAAALRRRLLDSVACGCSRRGPKPGPTRNPPSGKLSELLKLEFSDPDSTSGDDEDAESETRRKVEALEELKSAVKGLQMECGDRRRSAAAAVRRLAKDDAEARETLAMLGAIPPLIGMIDSDDAETQISALYALLNLGIGNDLNKAAIVKAGSLHKMLNVLKSRTDPSISEAIVANFLSLSALDSNKPIIGASAGAVKFLIKTFQFPTSSRSRLDALRALFNLSISVANIPLLVESDLVPHLLAAVGDMSLTDRILAVLSNLASTPEGRRAVTGSDDGVSILIDVLNWIDSPGCQEKAAYVLMVIAYRSETDRNAMTGLGIKSALLELVLVGSTLAQKRASRILEILGTGKGKEVSGGGAWLGLPAVSAPLVGEGEEVGIGGLVEESLQSNLKRIAKRANLMKGFGASDRIKGMRVPVTAGSRSLPF